MFGTWTPGGFPPWITLLAKVALFADVIVRGVDYLAGDDPATSWRLSTVESAAPLWAWGGLLTVAGAVGIGSIILRYGRGVLAAHLLGGFGYALLSVGILTDIVIRSNAGWSSALWPAVAVAVGVVVTVVGCRRWRWEYAAFSALGVTVAVASAIAAVDLDGLRLASTLMAVGAVHVLLGLGTAARLRQGKIEREGVIV